VDNRLYFVLGDIFSNVMTGALVGLCSWLLVSTSWNMWLAMVVTMVAGMAIGLILWLPLGLFFGAMEVMVPVMLSGMLSGMAVGMWRAMAGLDGFTAVVIGGACGLASLVYIWVLNNQSINSAVEEGGHD